MALGLAFTGWTYPTQPGMSQQRDNPAYYGGPMIAVESNHDMTAKTLLGQSIPAGQTAEADLNSALGIIFNHPNIGPFVARQLILRLVSSNPSPGYVQRVATAFNAGAFTSSGITYGTGNRGDMQAVIAAILLDTEARQGDSPITAVPTDGKLARTDCDGSQHRARFPRSYRRRRFFERRRQHGAERFLCAYGVQLLPARQPHSGAAH